MSQALSVWLRTGLVCTMLGTSGALGAHAACAQTGPATGNARMQNANITVISELSLPGAQKLLSKGLDLAAQRNVKLAIAVVDRAGNLLTFARMEDAPIVTIDVATGKARTAAFLKAPSKIFEDMINSGQPSMATTPGLVPLQGGMPVILDGNIIGAVGVSGSSGENDQAIATLIADSFAQP